MMKLLPLLLLAAGCASADMVCSARLPKSGVRHCKGDQRSVFVACGGAEGVHSDSGRLLTWKDDIIACWDAETKTVYREDSCRGAKAQLHERAHEEGVDDPDREGFDL